MTGLMTNNSEKWWKKPEWYGVIVALLVGLAGISFGAWGRCQADMALNNSKEAIRVAQIGLEVRGTAQASAELDRRVHEMSNGTDLIWEWYEESALVFDVTFTNLSRTDVSIKKVEVFKVFNSQEKSVYRKEYRTDEVRVARLGNSPIPIDVEDIDLMELDEGLGRSACSRVLNDERSCEAEKALEVKGRVVVTPVDGDQASSDFSLIIKHTPIRFCERPGQSIFTEPTEGCPPEPPPTPLPSPEATPTPETTPG